MWIKAEGEGMTIFLDVEEEEIEGTEDELEDDDELPDDDESEDDSESEEETSDESSEDEPNVN